MDIDRLCLSCNEVLGDEWARKGQKYCSNSCKMKYFYRTKYKSFYDSRYQKFKKEWEKSDSGKKAGIPIGQWFKLPKDWR